MPSNVLSLLELKDLSTSDALLALLANAKVMKFSQILQLLPPTASATSTQAEILRSLQQIAVLIRGNWVVKSHLLYPDKFCSRHSGVAASLLCRGRDYMLWKVSCDRVLEFFFLLHINATKMSILPPDASYSIRFSNLKSLSSSLLSRAT